MDDDVIHKLLTANDPQGIELLFRRYYRPLVLRADSILNDIPASEDIVQNFFITFWKVTIESVSGKARNKQGYFNRVQAGIR